MSETPLWLWVLMLTLSSARITHLITTDSITQWLRDFLAPNTWIDEMVHCPWCIGFWVSLAHAAWIPRADHRVAFTLVAAFAISYAVGALETRD